MEDFVRLFGTEEYLNRLRKNRSRIFVIGQSDVVIK